MSIDVTTGTGPISADELALLVSPEQADDPFNVVAFDPFRAPQGATVAPVTVTPGRTVDPAVIMADLESSAAALGAVACLVAFLIAGLVAYLVVA